MVSAWAPVLGDLSLESRVAGVGQVHPGQSSVYAGSGFLGESSGSSGAPASFSIFLRRRSCFRRNLCSFISSVAEFPSAASSAARVARFDFATFLAAICALSSAFTSLRMLTLRSRILASRTFFSEAIRETSRRVVSACGSIRQSGALLRLCLRTCRSHTSRLRFSTTSYPRRPWCPQYSPSTAL